MDEELNEELKEEEQENTQHDFSQAPQEGVLGPPPDLSDEDTVTLAEFQQSITPDDPRHAAYIGDAGQDGDTGKGIIDEGQSLIEQALGELSPEQKTPTQESQPNIISETGAAIAGGAAVILFYFSVIFILLCIVYLGSNYEWNSSNSI